MSTRKEKLREAQEDLELADVSEPMPVHPLAAVFPMMTDDELADLADDIKTNGQIHPIIVDGSGQLIDGRNRLRACEIAGVEPRIAPLNGHDPQAFIVSANLARRNLSKGQQAMALAMIYPEPEKGGRGKVSHIHESLGVSKGAAQNLLSQARKILGHSIDLAKQVIAGSTHFDEALKSVIAAEQKNKSRDAQLNELRTKAPDVAALVADERISLEAGLAELGQRQRAIRNIIESAKSSATKFVGLAAHVTIIEGALRLTDEDLAMIAVDPDDADPLSELPVKEIISAAAAIDELRHLKTSND